MQIPAGQELNYSLYSIPWATLVFSAVKSSQVPNLCPAHGLDIKGFHLE